MIHFETFKHIEIVNYFVPLILYIDPIVPSPQKALEEVGKRLQEQYERWQPRVQHYIVFSWPMRLIYSIYSIYSIRIY